MNWRNILEKHLISISGISVIFIYILYEILIYLLEGSKFFGHNIQKIGNLDMILLIFGMILISYSFLPKRFFGYSSKFKELFLAINNLQAISILTVLTVIGLIIRINNLGSLSFWMDEATQTYAALGLIQQGSPILPSGNIYNRAFLDTFLIAQSFKIFGVNEFAARLPSALFGVLTIPLVYLTGKELGNKRVGIIAAFLITFSVLENVWNRDARMYSQLQFLYLLTVYLFYIYIKNKNWKIIPAITGSFILAYYSHSQIWFFILIAFLYIIYIYFRNKVKTYTLLGILVSIIAFSILIFINFIVPMLVPEEGGKTILHYILTNHHFTLLAIIFISGIIFLISKNFDILKKENNFYLLINFFVPLLILSSFPWRQPRYAFFIYPFLLIIVSKILDYGLIRNGFENEFIKIFNNFKLKIASFNNIKTIFIIFIISLLISELAFSFNFTNYKEYSYQGQISQKTGQFIKNNLDSDDKVVSTSDTLVNLYYTGRSDYLIRQSGYELFDKNGSDIYSGAIILKGYDSFMQMVQNEKGWIISIRGFLDDSSMVDPKVRDYIRNNMTYRPEASDNKTEVYSWDKIRSNNTGR